MPRKFYLSSPLLSGGITPLRCARRTFKYKFTVKIIFTTSFGYMDQTNTVAGKFPNVKFEHATGFKREHPNVATYNARFYEPTFPKWPAF